MDAILQLRKELADIECSFEMGALTALQAEFGALTRIKRALAEADPLIQQQRLLRRVESVLSRLREEQVLAHRPKTKGGRPPVSEDIAYVRCIAVGAYQWLRSIPMEAAAAESWVLKALNGEERFIKRTGGPVKKSDLDNWRHVWLPAQETYSDRLDNNSAVPSYHKIVEIVKEALSGRTDPPHEAVAAAINSICNTHLRDEN